MTRYASVAAVLVLACSSFGPALASARQLPESVKTGMPVSVVDETGNVTEGRVDQVTNDLIRIKRRGRIEEVQLTRVVRIEKTDSLRNGAWTGIALGGTLGFIGAISATQGGDPPFGVILWVAAGNAAIYGALGTAIDGMIQGKRTLYERGRARETRIAPIVGPNVGGAVVRVSW